MKKLLFLTVLLMALGTILIWETKDTTSQELFRIQFLQLSWAETMMLIGSVVILGAFIFSMSPVLYWDLMVFYYRHIKKNPEKEEEYRARFISYFY